MPTWTDIEEAAPHDPFLQWAVHADHENPDAREAILIAVVLAMVTDRTQLRAHIVALRAERRVGMRDGL